MSNINKKWYKFGSKFIGKTYGLLTILDVKNVMKKKSTNLYLCRCNICRNEYWTELDKYINTFNFRTNKISSELFDGGCKIPPAFIGKYGTR